MSLVIVLYRMGDSNPGLITPTFLLNLKIYIAGG